MRHLWSVYSTVFCLSCTVQSLLFAIALTGATQKVDHKDPKLLLITERMIPEACRRSCRGAYQLMKPPWGFTFSKWVAWLTIYYKWPHRFAHIHVDVYGVTPNHSVLDILCYSFFLQAQAIFFTPAVLPVYDAFKWMGVMAVGIASFQILLWFPMWGGIIFPAKKGYTEQDYYYAEYTEAERMEGLHLQVSKFVSYSFGHPEISPTNTSFPDWSSIMEYAFWGGLQSVDHVEWRRQLLY